MDNCCDYNNAGASEVRMGKALSDGYRRKVFLMTKFDGRTKKAAALQIEESLAPAQASICDREKTKTYRSDRGQLAAT